MVIVNNDIKQCLIYALFLQGFFKVLNIEEKTFLYRRIYQIFSKIFYL